MAEAYETQTYEQWKVHRSCTRKRGYDSLVEANWDVLLLWKSGKHAETYDCAHCSKIHITTNESGSRSA